MKRKINRAILFLLLMGIGSCDEPETVVTNIIHPDGSVTRRIEMRSSNNEFSRDIIQVPVDSTWKVEDTVEISEKGDTTWIRRAERLFGSAAEITALYQSWTGGNSEAVRSAGFSKRFRWFSTIFRFSERIEATLRYGYPARNYLNPEELEFFYQPERVLLEKLSGPDSLRYKSLNDTIEKKAEYWIVSSLLSEWTEEFLRLTSGTRATGLTREILTGRSSETIKLLGELSDSAAMAAMIGPENFRLYRSEADSAMKIVNDRFDLSFAGYSVKFIMPGRLFSTNGFVGEEGDILWPVKSECFLSEPYEMWAESRIPNIWAWVVTGLFLAFVAAGLIIKIIRK